MFEQSARGLWPQAPFTDLATPRGTMYYSPALVALGCALMLIPDRLTQGAPARQEPPDSVFVTAAHGQALVPVQVIVRRDVVVSTGGKGSWAGDTLRTRTPLVLTLRAPTTLAFQALTPDHDVRVTLAGAGLSGRTGPGPRPLETITGAHLVLRSGPNGWSLSTPTFP
jgi:hypothetical protein